MLKAARASTDGQVIAVVQPHRYTRLSSLFDQFCTCFNDADAVIVAPVYAAGEQPIPGADRDGLVAGLKARGHRNAMALERSEDLAGLVKGIARPGDYVICLGAGNITQWAYALPGELEALGREGGVMFPGHHPRPARRAMPDLRGSLEANAPTAPAVLVPHRRPGAGAVHAGRRRTISPISSQHLDADIPVLVVGLGSNLLDPRRRLAGRRDPPRQGLRARSRSNPATASAPAPARPT